MVPLIFPWVGFIEIRNALSLRSRYYAIINRQPWTVNRKPYTNRNQTKLKRPYNYSVCKFLIMEYKTTAIKVYHESAWYDNNTYYCLLFNTWRFQGACKRNIFNNRCVRRFLRCLYLLYRNISAPVKAYIKCRLP